MTIGLGLVGYGYWGPNLARNASSMTGARLVGICESKAERAEKARVAHASVAVLDDYDRFLALPGLDAVMIATPVSSHHELCRRALLAGKDVMVEKPMTVTSAQGRDLLALAKEKGRILAVDHTFLFTGAVQKLKAMVASGELGRLHYIDSVRINLGLFQQDVDVIADLAPHDLSIVHHLVGRDPLSVSAVGISHAGRKLADQAYLHLDYGDSLIAHFHVNWLSPVKIRHFLVGGSKKMVVYDDMEPSEKVKVYDRGITVRDGDLDGRNRLMVDYRMGDMVAPKLAHREALSAEMEHFVACVKDRKQPIADGASGLAVVRIIEAAQRSLAQDGKAVKLEDLP